MSPPSLPPSFLPPRRDSCQLRCYLYRVIIIMIICSRRFSFLPLEWMEISWLSGGCQTQKEPRPKAKPSVGRNCGMTTSFPLPPFDLLVGGCRNELIELRGRFRILLFWSSLRPTAFISESFPPFRRATARRKGPTIPSLIGKHVACSASIFFESISLSTS